MDVTPQVINEVEFHQKMRGYDPDEVDDFLERVAVAVGGLQERARDAADRAVVAERRAADLESRLRDFSSRSDPSPAPAAVTVMSDEEADTIKRTLVLAQRTADAAVKEAEATAARAVESAREQARQILADARDEARRLAEAADAEARRGADETRQRLVSEIIAFEEHRDTLRADQGILERHLEEQRLRLRSSIGELQRLLDDPARLRLAGSPELTFSERPTALPAEAVGDTGGDGFDAGPTTPSEADADQGRSSVDTDLADHGEDRFDGDGWGPGTDDATQSFTVGDADDDVYMAELRKAMMEDTSPPEGLDGLFDDDLDRGRARGGRRR